MDLKTTFAGLNLRNPIIVSSSGLTNNAAKNKKLEEAGAGAIVLKSLFEEQILLQAGHLDSTSIDSPESMDYLNQYVRSHHLNEFINLIKDTKKSCSIPVIASINCYNNAEWTDFAIQMEEAGSDALEINILAVQTNPKAAYGEFEQQHIDILKSIKEKVKLPIIVKLGSNLTNPIALINQLYANDAAAVVLFNRFYQPDIDIESMEYTSGEVFSHPSDLANSLRWTGIASAAVDRMDYAVSGGVHNGKAIIKSILAGASAVEVCSTIYKNGAEIIGSMKLEMEKWMQEKGYEQIAQFKGKMNAKGIEGVNMFERTQFLRYFGTKE